VTVSPEPVIEETILKEGLWGDRRKGYYLLVAYAEGSRMGETWGRRSACSAYVAERAEAQLDYDLPGKASLHRAPGAGMEEHSMACG
jgi:hypothetical protein